MRRILKKLAGTIGRCERGFTLVELLVVIGIIVVLAGVTVVAVTQFSGSGTTAAKAGEKDTVQTSIETMIADKKPPLPPRLPLPLTLTPAAAR